MTIPLRQIIKLQQMIQQQMLKMKFKKKFDTTEQKGQNVVKLLGK